MKNPSIFSKLAVLFALSLMTSAAFADWPEVSTLMAEGQRAYAAGDLDAAKLDFQTVLQSDPLNQVAIAFLRRIGVAEKNGGIGIESQLQKIMIPKVDLKGATLSSVFPYLTQQTVKLSGGKVHPNFVVALPQSFQTKTTVTLSLADVSVADVLHYIAGLANIEFSYQQNAIFVTPVAPLTPVAAPSSVAIPAETPVSGSASSNAAQ